MGDGEMHTGHRKRMRRRYIKDGGFDNFEYHEIVEMLLYYAVKRADTNELAHKMLDEFGSFHALLDASVSEIMERCGVSENTAFIISMIPQAAKRYAESIREKKLCITTKRDVYELLASEMKDRENECFYLICLDSKYCAIKTAVYGKSSANSVDVSVNKLVKAAVESKAVFVIIAHNHPGNTLTPSSNDISATRSVKTALDTVNITLIDHIIMCGDKCYSFAQNKLCGLATIDKEE